MKKNVLVLTGSPRKGGNSDLMADAFIEGAREAGHQVVKFETAEKNIIGCKACDTCFSKGVACSFKDDFGELVPLLEKADLIVFATPLYWYTFPTQIKAVIDKLYSFIVGQRPLKIKECMLLVCGEEKDKKKFDGIIKSYEFIAINREWNDVGKLIVPGVIDKGDIKNTDALKKSKELGIRI
ncbi:flavodoxin family protein [Clostridium kluyveri]|uniref:flavodoxin family protein n=1 Tax=Clostridium kluyveri TaxID=1534 RepID=UPI00224689A4|nr:flavodoxin family protein [Clostridium kluyveri]UZQ49544.1 flavodoxin family protein [Clostridium kluyveri]